MRKKNPSHFVAIEKFVDKYAAEHNGRCPSVREIGDEIGISAATVSRYLRTMQNNGVLEYDGGHRNIMTQAKIREASETCTVPVLGSVSCGIPVFAEENIEEYVRLPVALFGNGDYYILRANGDSMIDAGINNGDLVLIKQQETADDGDIVVALVGDEATLKRLKHSGDTILLHPENEAYEDIVVSELLVQGIAKKIIKDIG